MLALLVLSGCQSYPSSFAGVTLEQTNKIEQERLDSVCHEYLERDYWTGRAMCNYIGNGVCQCYWAYTNPSECIQHKFTCEIITPENNTQKEIKFKIPIDAFIQKDTFIQKTER